MDNKMIHFFSKAKRRSIKIFAHILKIDKEIINKPLKFLTTLSNLKLILQKYFIGKYIHIKVRGIDSIINLRRNSQIDQEVLISVFLNAYHFPSRKISLPSSPIILDLGSNIGLTIIDFKNKFPDSTVIGYEMDYDNHLLSLRNCKNYENVKLYNCAIWKENGIVTYNKDDNYDAYSISLDSNTNIKYNKVEVKSITISEIFRTNNLEHIDYLKIDIEGAEKEIFYGNDISWLQKVSALNLEVHDLDKEILNNYISLLNANGFEAWKDDNHWSAIMAKRN
jgi:FkbM family methyltransferase